MILEHFSLNLLIKGLLHELHLNSLIASICYKNTINSNQLGTTKIIIMLAVFMKT